MRVLAAILIFCAAAAGVSPVEAVPRPGAVEIKGPKGVLGQLTVETMDDGASYVPAERLAGLLKGSWTAKGKTGTLTVSKRSAQFSRDQSRLTLQGQPLVLDSAPRATAKGWLLPLDFLDKGLGRLAPGTTVIRPVSAAARAPLKRVDMSVQFEELRFRSYPSFTRIVIEAGSGLSYLTVPGKGEIRVRLSGLVITAPQAEDIGDGLVKEVRLESAGPDGVLKIVLEGSAGEVKTASLQDPFRVVVDVYRPKEGASVRGPRPAQGSAPPLRLIVLDAGHGGHDQGAKGPGGVLEKDVVLDVTRRAARMIEDGLGVKVVLTRSTDVFVPLRERTNFANKQRADLFVSIHANAHPRAVSEGVETYFLSSEATDNESRQIAAIENGVVQLESPQSRQKTRPAQEHPVGHGAVGVPAGIELPRRDGAGLDDPVAPPRQSRGQAGGLLRAGRRGHARCPHRDRLPHQSEGRKEAGFSGAPRSASRAPSTRAWPSTSGATTSECARRPRPRCPDDAPAMMDGPRISSGPSGSPATISATPKARCSWSSATPR